MAASRIRRVINASGTTYLEVKQNAQAQADAVFADMGFIKVEGYGVRYTWKDSAVYMYMDLETNTASLTFRLGDSRGSYSSGTTITAISYVNSLYTLSLTLDAYISGNSIVLLVYGTSTTPSPFVITTAMIDGFQDYLYSSYPTTSSNDTGLRLIDALTRPVIQNYNVTAVQAVKIDNCPVLSAGTVRGYISSMSALIASSNSIVFYATADGHKYICVMLQINNNTSVIGLEVE